MNGSRTDLVSFSALPSFVALLALLPRLPLPTVLAVPARLTLLPLRP